MLKLVKSKKVYLTKSILSLRKQRVLVGVDNIKFSKLEQIKFVLRTTCKDYSPPLRSCSRPISAQWACQLEPSHLPLSQTPSTRVSRCNCHMTVPSITITSSPLSVTLESVSCHEPKRTRIYSLITPFDSLSIATLPYSIRVLLESAVRNCDDFAVKE